MTYFYELMVNCDIASWPDLQLFFDLPLHAPILNNSIKNSDEAKRNQNIKFRRYRQLPIRNRISHLLQQPIVSPQ